MDSDILKKAYSTSEFRSLGHRWVDLLADHLESSLQGTSEQVIRWHPPEDERIFWSQFMENGDPSKIAELLLERCIHIHHPRYMGHQISPIAPIGALTSLLGATLNNGMGIYEMGAAPTAMERVVTDMLCRKVGFDNKANGFLTSGGTLANLTALLSARQYLHRKHKDDEIKDDQLVVLVSEEAHYCIDRATKIMGLGASGIVKIPVDSNYRMRTDLLAEYLDTCKTNGVKVMAIVGSAPSTATGIYDDIAELGRLAAHHDIWFHIDGAHGGAAIFSDKYRSLLKGIEQADSVVIDGHKMMMMPSITTALLFKDGRNSDKKQTTCWRNRRKKTGTTSQNGPSNAPSI